MAQALTLLESITSTPTSSVHPVKTLRQPSYVQNTNSSAVTMNVDAPLSYAFYDSNATGATNGDLFYTLTREELRKVYPADVSNSAQPVKVVATNTTLGVTLNVAIGDVNYAVAGEDVTAQCAVTGTLTTAFSGRAVLGVTSSGVDIDPDPYEVDYVVEDVAGTMTLTSVTIVNGIRDLSLGDTGLFQIMGQDAQVAGVITFAAGNFTASKELKTFHIQSVTSQQFAIKAGTRLSVTWSNPDPQFYWEWVEARYLNLTKDVVVPAGGITPYLVKKFKCANSASTFNFVTLT